MSDSFQQHLAARLADVKRRGLHRQLRRVDSPQGREVTIDGRALLNFSSNDYLGLANHPALKAAAAKALEDFGVGAGASRLICGSLAPHHELEEELAAFKGTESALAFSSGYAAATGTLGALVGRGDVVLLDRLCHACLIDAARLSGARLRVFAHKDLDALERSLRRLDQGAGATKPRVLIVTESVFSMDGDTAPLRELVELKERFGAWLLLDEAHATGVYGERGRGLAEAAGVSNRIEVQMGTLGKALGSAGGFIVGPRALTDHLVNHARSFIFSTAPTPATAAAATAALRLLQTPEGSERRRALWERAAQLKALVPRCGSPTKSDLSDSPIQPWTLGDETRAVRAADALRERGFLVPAIRFPTVAKKQARLRFTVTAGHTPEDLQKLAGVLRELAAAESPA